VTDQELLDFYESTLERIAAPTDIADAVAWLHDYNRIIGEAERALEVGRSRPKTKRRWRPF